MKADKLTRREMCRIWDKTTGLNNSGYSPLTHRIIDEAMDCGENGGGENDPTDPEKATRGLYRLARDIEDFANAIADKYAVPEKIRAV